MSQYKKVRLCRNNIGWYVWSTYGKYLDSRTNDFAKWTSSKEGYFKCRRSALQCLSMNYKFYISSCVRINNTMSLQNIKIKHK